MKTSLLKEIILDQGKWPFPENYIHQSSYDTLIPFLKTPDILVITGVRRCGKSTLMQAIRRDYGEGDYYLNFEDDRLVEFSLEDFQILLETFIELFGKQNTFYFDEIQVIPGWERFVRRLYNEGKKVILTGSNANLFSRELGTKLTGRYISIEVYPLSFSEVTRSIEPKLVNNKNYSTDQKGNLLHLFSQYEEIGGIPEYRLYKHPQYLQTLYESIIFRDIVTRYKITDDRPIRELVYLLTGAVGKPITFNSLRKTLGLGSTTTITDYCDYLEGCYLCFFISCYDSSLKRQMNLPKKVYFIDHALARLIGFRTSEDRGRLLENLVFIELKRRNAQIYYHRQKFECDFVIREGTKIISAIQVCAEMMDAETREREINGLVEAMQLYNLKKGMILTANQEEKIVHENLEIEILPIWKWML